MTTEICGSAQLPKPGHVGQKLEGRCYPGRKYDRTLGDFLHLKSTSLQGNTATRKMRVIDQANARLAPILKGYQKDNYRASLFETPWADWI